MSTFNKIGDSLWKGFKSAAKFTAKIGSDIVADGAEALQSGIKNTQANTKARIDARTDIDNPTKTVAKIGTDVVGYSTRGLLGFTKIVGKAVKKNL